VTAAQAPGPLTTLAGPDGFFEDFPLGRKMRHVRSATITDVENNQLSKQMMNTAQAHWNEHVMPEGRLVFGLVTGSVVLGLASQDTMSQALAEVGVDDLAFLAPVRQGTTLTAFSEVVGVEDDPTREDAGLVTFQHHGVDHTGRLVFRGRRTVLVKRRSHWAAR
jgi:itaconyl-CoA hydratase